MKKLFSIILLFVFIDCFAPTFSITYLRNDMYILEKIRTSNELENYLLAIAESESGNWSNYPYKGFNSPWHIINSFGAAGRWQLMKVALKEIKYTGTITTFLNDSILQKECMIKLIKRNNFYLNYYIKDVNIVLNKEIYGTVITLSGLLAACHLAGIGNVLKFLKYGYNASDGNKSVKDYINDFSGYDLSYIL